MRIRTLLPTLALFGCHNVPTEPYHTTAQAAPSGLVVSAALATSSADVSADPTITAVGDSVMVTAAFGSSLCGLDFGASAGLVDGALVITGIGTFPAGGARCVSVAYAAGPTFHAVVRAVPSGRYTVIVRARVQEQLGGAAYHEREIGRGAVTIP